MYHLTRTLEIINEKDSNLQKNNVWSKAKTKAAKRQYGKFNEIWSHETTEVIKSIPKKP